MDTMNTQPTTLHSRPFPGLLLVIAALVVLAASFFIAQRPVVLQLADTYYVFESQFAYYFFSGLLLSGWLIYRFSTALLYSMTLAWIHVILSLILIIAILVKLVSDESELSGMPRRYYDFESGGTVLAFFRDNPVLFFLMLLLVVQLLYLVNLGLGIRKKSIRRGATGAAE